MIKRILILIFAFISFSLSAQTYYVADTLGNIYYKDGYFNTDTGGLMINSGKYLLDDGLIKTENPLILSFQTNKSGVFTPKLTPTLGNFIWDFGDGSTFIESNAPSHTYTDGITKTVKVLKNSATTSITQLDLNSENIIGVLDFSDISFSTATLNVASNTGLTEMIFNSGSNLVNDFRGQVCGFSSLDFSSVDLNGVFYGYSNDLSNGVSFKEGSTSNDFQVFQTDANSLDLSDIELTSTADISDNTSLTSLIFNSSNSTNNIDLSGNTSLDSLIINFDFDGVVKVDGCTSLSLLNITSSGNTASTFEFYNTAINGVLDLSSIVINGTIRGDACANITGVTFSSGSNSISDLKLNFSGFTSMDFSNVELTGIFNMNTCSSLAAITWGTITTGVSSIRLDGCALTESEVDEPLVLIDNFFSANTPVKNLAVNVSGGTNSAPSATGTTAISNTQGYYTTAGFLYTATTN